MRADCHQHLWPSALIEALRRRDTPPYLDDWTLRLAGEPAYDVRPEDHDPDARRALDATDDIGRAAISLSSPLGIEDLPPDDAAPLLDAWHRGIAELPDEHYLAWAAAGLREPDPDGLTVTLKGPRFVGLQLPATAFATPSALDRVAPLLDVCERAGLPLLIHPGPAAPNDAAQTAEDLPPWWPALVPYVAQQQAAWFAWHVAGRANHPHLRVAFVALAGLAPLHHERLTARGGKLGPIDPRVYYETSSYGTRAVDAMTRVVGVDPIVHGSDRPYATPKDPGLGEAFSHAVFVSNPAHLLGSRTAGPPTAGSPTPPKYSRK